MKNQDLINELREKYNMKEEIYVHGTFIDLTSVDWKTSKRLCLCVSRKCLVVASTDLSDEKGEYELESIVPLSLLKFRFHNKARRLMVCGDSIPRKIFQLVNSPDEVQVWEEFKTHIKYLTSKHALKEVMDEEISRLEGRSHSVVLFGQDYGLSCTALSDIQTKMETWYRAQTSLNTSNRLIQDRSTEMPAILASTETLDDTYLSLKRYRSEPCIFSGAELCPKSFVKKYAQVKKLTNCIGKDNSVRKANIQDKSNNYASLDRETGNEGKKLKKEGKNKWYKRIARLFRCCCGNKANK